MNKLRIKDMADNERPVEKLAYYGADKLSDAELLAIILRTGSNDMSVIELSQMILNSHPIHKGLKGLNYRYIEDLIQIPGVGRVKASQIIAITEISRRMSSENSIDKIRLDSPDTVADYFMEEVRYLTKERVYALYFSTANDLIHKTMISEGTLDRSIMSPRDIFKEALRLDAASIILIHNHPSGNPRPSDMDIIITKRIKQLGEDMGIKLLDHIIIGDGIYYSLLENELIN